MSDCFNSSNCPGTDVILELLRAEHDQVKQRTDIIKQLISFNCLSKSDVSKLKISPNSLDTVNSSKNQHKNSFGNSQTSKRNQVPTYSQFQRDVFHQSTPNKVKNQPESPVKKPTFAQNTTNLKKQFSNDKANKSIGNKTPAHKAIANQTEVSSRNMETEMNPHENYDYKFEAYKLLQEVADLKVAARKYEEEKSEWIHEKRQQIKILQELRDASCDETKAAMKLTSWKPSDIECNPSEYEDCKTKWLLCKKRQIELLEKLRGVSLCEIKRTIQKVSVPETLDFDCSKIDERPKTCTDMIDNVRSFSQELFNSDKFAVRICTPTQKNECFDKDKININIMMKSNSNVNKQSSSPTEISEPALKGSPCKSVKINYNNSGLFKDSNSQMPPLNDLVNFDANSDSNSDSLNCPKDKNETLSNNSIQIDNFVEIPIDELKKTIENKIGRKLFQNTYNLLKQLNCPELILQSTKGDTQVAEIVFNYIIQERKINKEIKSV